MSRGRAAIAAAAGPTLIIAATLVLLHEFAFFGMVSAQHVDPLAFWLPTHCFLGESLATGAIPSWNPHVLGGIPFAADPQSGWMYLPAMVLYTLLPCGAALRWFIVLQPILAGLGIYWFLRSEGLSRPAASVGGVMLALAIASSRVAVTLPFSGALAWTSILLACASRYFRAMTWPSRVAWAVLAAGAWGQVAAAHMSHGLALATAALVFYGVAVSLGEMGRGRNGRERLAAAGLLAVALVLVNLAFFLPRTFYLPRTTLALGYGQLESVADRLAGRPPSSTPLGASVAPPWILGFATSPGAYLGLAPLALSVGAWWRRRSRHLAWSFGLFALICYILPLRAVASFIQATFSWLPFADIYVHEPARFRYGVLLALPVLASVGVEAWRESPRRRAWILLPGLLLWGLLPLLAGADAAHLALPAVGMAAGVAGLAGGGRRPQLLALVPAALAVELTANGVLGQGFRSEPLTGGPDPPFVNVPFTPLTEPNVRASDYLRPGPIVTRLRSETARYLSLDRERLGPRGYLEHQGPASWGLLANQRATLFGLEDAQGYNPVQPLTYWMLLRAVEPKDIKYNAAIFVEPPEEALDLLHVGWIVGPSSRPPTRGATATATEGRWTLYRLPQQSPRASALTRWTVVDDHAAALAKVRGPGFDPAAEVVLEEDPGVPEGGAGMHVTRYSSSGPGKARVIVDGPSAAVVLVRNVYDPNWRARVDGRPVRLLRADSSLQAVPIPAGRHVIDLDYHDPWVVRGLLGSGVAVGGLAWAGVVLGRREHRRTRRSRGEQEEERSNSGGQRRTSPSEERRQGHPEHGQEQQTRGDVHAQREERNHSHHRGEVAHPEPPGREETGNDQQEQ